MPPDFFPRAPLLVALLALGLTAACSRQAAVARAPAPRPVTVYPTRAEDITSSYTQVGRITAYNSVEIRTRVQGIVQKIAFTEGTNVTKGTLLFVLEPDVYQQAVQQARAQLERAEAEAARALGYEQRLARLVAADAVSRQDYDNAVTSAKQADSSVAGARAALERAQLDLGYTKVLATEDGRIGRSNVSEGGLVGREGPTHLATIDKIDPVFVTFTVSDLALLSYREALRQGTVQSSAAAGTVQVYLPNGAPYANPGKIDFEDQQVNPDTGTVTLRALVPNPRGELLPGMFVRAELNAGTRPAAILIPQSAVIKVPTGHIAWIAIEGKAERRDLVLGNWQGDRWIVEKGLGAGEQVIVTGTQGLTAGAPVQIIPAAAPAAR